MEKVQVTTKYGGTFDVCVGTDMHLLNLVGETMLSTGRIHEALFLEWFGSELQSRKDQNVLVLDIGANIGTFSLYVLHAHATAKVLAYEPLPWLVSVLAENLKPWSLDSSEFPQRACYFQLALGNKRDKARFRVVQQNYAQSHMCTEAQAPYAHEVINVPMFTLDSFGYNFTRTASMVYVKIDTEGFEPFVLVGMHKFILEHRPTFMLENNCIEDAEVCFNLLKQLNIGYQMSHIMRTDEGSENWICVYDAPQK